MIMIMFMLVMFGLVVCMIELLTLDVLSESSVLCTVPVRVETLERPDICYWCLYQVIVVSRYWLMLMAERLRHWLIFVGFRIIPVPRPHRLFIPDPPLRPP